MKKLILLLIISCFSVILAASNSEPTYNDYMNSLKNLAPAEIARLLSDSLNQSTPTKIDSGTTTYSVTSNKNSITFHNFLDMDLIYKTLKKTKLYKDYTKSEQSKLNKIFMTKVKNNLKSDLCQDNLYKAALDSGVIIFSEYKNTQNLMGIAKITKYDCEQQ